MLVSALTSKSEDAPPARLLLETEQGALRMVICRELMREYREVLLRPKIAARHRRSPHQIAQYLRRLQRVAKPLRLGPYVAEGPDANDGHLWALARAHGNAIVITGDHALLRDPPPGLRAISPRDFLRSRPR